MVNKAEVMEKARYLKHVKKYKGSTQGRDVELCARYQRGDKSALTELLDIHLRFLVSIASGFLNRGLPLDDLVGEAVSGMSRAIEAYDTHRGVKFITYAVWWAQKAVREALARMNPVFCAPVAHQNTIKQVFAAGHDLAQEGSCSVTVAAIAQRTGKHEWEVARAINLVNPAVARDSRGFAIYDSAIKEEPSACGDDPFTVVAKTEVTAKITKALATLSSVGRRVVLLRCGIGAGNQLTFKDIGENVGLSKQRAQQIYAEAINKLRRGGHAEGLREALDTLRALDSNNGGDVC